MNDNQRIERWQQIITQYRRRHRQWAMAYLPEMPEDQWQQYQKWIADFALLQFSASMRDALRRERKRKTVTAKVTPLPPKVWARKNTTRMVFGEGRQLALVDLDADGRRATRRLCEPPRRGKSTVLSLGTSKAP